MNALTLPECQRSFVLLKGGCYIEHDAESLLQNILDWSGLNQMWPKFTMYTANDVQNRQIPNWIFGKLLLSASLFYQSFFVLLLLYRAIATGQCDCMLQSNHCRPTQCPPKFSFFLERRHWTRPCLPLWNSPVLSIFIEEVHKTFSELWSQPESSLFQLCQKWRLVRLLKSLRYGELDLDREQHDLPVGGSTFCMNMKIAFSGLTFILFLMT